MLGFWRGLTAAMCMAAVGCASAQWSAPVLVSGDVNPDGGNADLAVTSGGNWILVWERTANGAVKYSKSGNRGASWIETEFLNPFSGWISAGSPSIAADLTSGTFLAAWESDNFDDSPDAAIARANVGQSGFPTLTQVGQNNVYFGMARPAIASGEAATYILGGVSSNRPVTDEAIQLYRSTNNGLNWTAVGALGRENVSPQFDRNMDIAGDGSGNYVLVTESLVGSPISPSRINARFSRSVDGGATWASLANIDTSDNTGDIPKVAASNGGRFLSILSRGNAAGNLLAYATSDAGATWGAPVSVNTAGIIASVGLNGQDIAVDKEGNAVAVWSAKDPLGPRNRLYFSTSRDFGASWSAVDALTTPTTDASDEQPVIEYDGQGRWAAAWQRRSFGTSTTLSMQSSNLIFPIRADLSVSQTDSPDPATVGEQITYKMTVRNDGPSSATGVQMVNTTPAGLSVVSVTQSKGTRTETSGSITFDFGDLNEGATATGEVKVLVNEYGIFKNVVQVSADQEDTDLGDRISTETTKVLVDGIDLTGEWQAMMLDIPRRGYDGRLDVNTTFVVQNLGNQRARGFKILLMLSDDDILSDDDAFVDVLNVPHLGPGNERRLRWKKKLRRYTPWQGKQVLAIIDAEMRVDEEEEFNNSIASEELPVPEPEL